MCIRDSFEAGHKTLVRVGAGIRNSVQSLRVFDDAPDVVQRELGESRVAVACKEILLTLPDRLMHVHTGTVVADDRLRHERRRLAMLCSNVVDGILQAHDPVAALNEGRKLRADFILTRGCHFMVMDFNHDTHAFERLADFGADVLERIDRRNGEVTALNSGAMALVTGGEGFTCGPR